MRRALLVAAVAAGVLLGGCSAVKLAYDNADSYLRWRIGAYLDVNGDASDELDERIDDFMDWHRAKALPQYARLSEEAARRLGKGLSPEDVVWGYDALQAQARESLRASAERLAPMLDKLSPEQVRYLERRLAEDNRKFARENLKGSEADRRKLRAKRLQERLEEWVGKLTPAQVDRIRQYAESAPLTDEHRDRDRRRLQGEFLDAVRKQQAARRLPDLAARWQEGRDPAFTALNETWRKEFNALIVDFDRSLTPAQRSRAVANFRRYAEDFAILAGRSAPQ